MGLLNYQKPQGLLGQNDLEYANALFNAKRNQLPSAFQGQEPGLQAPMFSPDDLIGSGIPTKLAMLAKGALMKGGGLGLGMLGHTVYHGSPHLFDKFSLEKIGTGEGAQAYGHGLYFAENPAVANQYKDQNVFRAFDIAPEAEKRGLQLTSAARGELIRQAGANPDPMIAAKKLQYANATTRDIPQEKLAELIDGYQKAQSGNLYKVDIPDEAIPKMLDWDKPLSEQSKEVQDFALRNAGKLKKELKAFQGNPNNGDLAPKNIYEMTGADLLGALGRGGEAEAALHQAGITGIRYLDAGSRGAGKGSSNFVLFDDSLANILERNGKKLSDLGGK